MSRCRPRSSIRWTRPSSPTPTRATPGCATTTRSTTTRPTTGHRPSGRSRRFEHVWDAVRRPEVFSSASGLTFFRDEIGQLGLPPTIVMLDPPVQTRLRALIGRALHAPARDSARGRHPGVRPEPDRRHDAGAPRTGRPWTCTRTTPRAVPTWVLAELFGLPESDRERFGPWVQTLTRLQNDGFDANALVGDAGTDSPARRPGCR